MISRLSAVAATFAVLATASLAFASGVHQDAVPAPAGANSAVRVVQFERVVITAKRLPGEARQAPSL
jgi:hypothetical protein